MKPCCVTLNLNLGMIIFQRKLIISIVCVLLMHFIFIASLYIFFDEGGFGHKNWYDLSGILFISFIGAFIFTTPAFLMTQVYAFFLRGNTWLRSILIVANAELSVVFLSKFLF